MEITFLGATRTVTGSLHLFEYQKQKFLIECGLYQGPRDEADRINQTFSFKPKEIKAVILSHGHLDHSGNLPNLVKRGFAGPIYCTPATMDIATIILLDAAKIQESDFAYLNKRHQEKGLPLKSPLYTIKDTEQTLKQFLKVNYDSAFEVVKGLRATFYDAGHILGSSTILLETEDKRILFSGDLGRKNMPIIRDPVFVPNIDCFILESTYGGTTHESFDEMTGVLKGLIEQGKRNRSKIIIPAFAVERTQVLLTMLRNLYEEGTLENIPVYVDSPMATDMTDVFRRHPECFDEETYKIFVDRDPFNFPGLRCIKDSEESKALNGQNGPMIIIAGSGMCEGGRVTHHLIHSIEQETNMIIITGFQARGTLGRKILDRADKVSIFNSEYRVRARVYFMGGLSAHADENDLFEYVKKIRDNRLKKVYLIHGEIDQATSLKNRIESLNNIEVDIPQSGTKIII